MITKYKLFLEDAEMTQCNTTGNAGDGAGMGGQGQGQAYQRSGGLNGDFGNTFAPKSPKRDGAYKHKKFKKRRFVKNIEKR